MTSVSKNIYIDILGDIVGKYNNTYHRTNKMKPVNVKDIIFMDFKKEVNDKGPLMYIIKFLYLCRFG